MSVALGFGIRMCLFNVLTDVIMSYFHAPLNWLLGTNEVICTEPSAVIFRWKDFKSSLFPPLRLGAARLSVSDLWLVSTRTTQVTTWDKVAYNII